MQCAQPTPALLQRVQHAYTALQVPEYRACQLCRHGSAGGQACVRDSLRPVPVAVARAAHGACGPHALHLDMAAWGPQR